MNLPETAHLPEPVRVFLAEHAQIAPDPFCPELLVANAKDLSKLWKRMCDYDRVDLAPIPFWGAVWPGGRAIARYLLDHPELARDKRVLDLACGGGIVAAALAKCGARVVALDIEPLALALTGWCLELNGLACELRQGDIALLGPADAADFDLIIAADVFYEESLAHSSEKFLRLAAGMGVPALVGDPLRAYCPRKGIRELARYRTPTLVEIEGAASRDAIVLQMEPTAD